MTDDRARALALANDLALIARYVEGLCPGELALLSEAAALLRRYPAPPSALPSAREAGVELTPRMLEAALLSWKRHILTTHEPPGTPDYGVRCSCGDLELWHGGRDEVTRAARAHQISEMWAAALDTLGKEAQ
jgi:hypothetical protein